MNINGTIYMIDEPHIDVLKQSLSTLPPPGGRLAAGTIMCMDMDETDNMLEIMFPDHCQKATLLCPPPIAMYKEIDGDQEGFIESYNEYLDYDESVQEFIASMLMFLHIGGNILIYTPSYIDDDPIWLNTLSLFFYTRFGITIGTSQTDVFNYDPRYDDTIAEYMYSRGFMDVFDYLRSSSPIPIPQSSKVYQQLCLDLYPYCASGENPIDLYVHAVNCLQNGLPIYKPAIMFDK